MNKPQNQQGLVHVVLPFSAARRVSGIVVSIGFNQTSIVPVLNGRAMHNVGVWIVGMGDLKLTEFLTEKMQHHDMIFSLLCTARTLKEVVLLILRILTLDFLIYSVLV